MKMTIRELEEQEERDDRREKLQREREAIRKKRETREKRQQSVLNEVVGVRSVLLVREVFESLTKEYGSDRDATQFVLESVGSEGFIDSAKYVQLLQTFSPFLRRGEDSQRGDGRRVGYHMWEVANILKSPWWKGNMPAPAFNRLLRSHPHSVFVRTSTSDPGAFVFGFYHRMERNPKYWKYHIKDYMIDVQRDFGPPSTFGAWRTLTQLYTEWVHSEWAGHREVKTPGRTSEAFGAHHPLGAQPLFARPVSGKMDGASTAIYVGEENSSQESVGERQDWSPWLA